jgi:hypothetical protein
VRFRSITLLVCAFALIAAACGGSSSDATPSAPTTVAEDPNAPSAKTQMVCADEAIEDIEVTLGVEAKDVSKPTWEDHLFACDYEYGGDKAMTLSVKQLTTAEDTTAYFDSLAKQLGKGEDLSGMGEAAFLTKNDNVVVRKDDLVLLVDVSKLPDQFGDPAAAKDEVAKNVASTIMGCWV